MLSCRSGDSTGPLKVAPLPADSLPKLVLLLPPGEAMTAGTTEHITLTVSNVRPQSCAIAAPAWLGLSAGADPNPVWTVTPTATGAATIIATCLDARNAQVVRRDTLQVYEMPTVTPDISGVVPVDVGDSVDASYDSTFTLKIDVACSHCDTLATLKRVGPNTLRLVAKAVPADAVPRGICFTVHGLDGRYTQQECVTVSILSAQLALYSVPMAIRTAEVVPLHTVPVATYDGSGQSNHPDFMRVSAPWAAGACWLSYTPYYKSNGILENPSLATSPDCEHWAPAAGVPAPLVAKPVDAYNSDPELVYDAQRGCLGVVFRQVSQQNVIFITGTCDGKTFSAPRQLFAAPNHNAVSPSVTPGPDGFNRIWYVSTGQVGCTSQTNVVKMRTATSSPAGLDSIQFGAEVPTDLAQYGYVIWHLKVRYVPALKLYVAMYAAFPFTTGVGNCMNDDLFMATSLDGLHWQTFPAPILDHLDKRFKFTSLYRASFQYTAGNDQLRTIVSALDVAGNWGEYGVVHNYTVLTTALNSSWTVSAAQLVPSSRLVRKADAVTAKVIMEDRP